MRATIQHCAHLGKKRCEEGHGISFSVGLDKSDYFSSETIKGGLIQNRVQVAVVTIHFDPL